MKNLEERNQRIIDAIIQKANHLCPGALALIGIYGSFNTGNAHEKSDLDLLILINDEGGFQLSAAFIQEDLQIGHDLYCTTWEALEHDAEYTHPNISKLMDSRIVYCAAPKYLKRLEALRQKASAGLQAPLSRDNFEKATVFLKEAEHAYIAALMEENLSRTQYRAGGAIYCIENALAMLNRSYFQLGTSQTIRELEALPLCPAGLRELIEAVLAGETPEQITNQLLRLIRETAQVFADAEKSIPGSKSSPTQKDLRGTYEEMFSNWRNKLYTAAASGDRHLALMSLTSMQAMLDDIQSQVDIGLYDVLACYAPSDLYKTAADCDALLEDYLTEYTRLGITARRYRDTDAFLEEYLHDTPTYQ